MTMRIPNIPEYQRQGQYQNPSQPGARLQGMQVQTNDAMFGGDTGRNLQIAGQQMQQAAKELSHTYVDYQHTKATEAFNKFQDALTDDLYGPEGIFNLEGEAAMEAPAKAQALLEARGREFAQNNGLAQGFFEDYVGRFRRELMPQLGRFAAEQRKAWMTKTQEKRAATSQDLALRNYAEGEVYRGYISEGRDAMRKAGELAGLPPEEIQKKVAAFTSNIYEGITITHISNGDYPAAEGIIKSGMISDPDAIRLQEHISIKKKADLQLGLTLKHEAERQAAESWEDQLTMSLDRGDMAAATELAAKAPAGLKEEGVALVDHYAKGKRVVNNEEEAWKWQQIMVNDPQRFVDEWNSARHMNSMDKETRSKFTAARDKLKAGDKSWHGQLVTDAIILSEGYKDMGIKDPKNAKGDDLAHIMEFNQRFQEEVDAFTGEKKRTPTTLEKMKLRDRMLLGFVSEKRRFLPVKEAIAFEADKEPMRPQGLPEGATWDRQRLGWIHSGKFLPASAVV